MIEHNILGHTFEQQAEVYFAGLMNRRSPVAPGTLKRYRSYLDSRLLPLIGPRTLQELENGAAKAVISQLSEDLSASTVAGIFHVFKAVIASATDQNGNQLYPRTWNLAFLDLPAVRRADQDAPEIPRKTLQEAISGGSGQSKLLWALLAGSGLRIREALAVRTIPDGRGNYWDPAAKTIRVQGQLQDDGSFADPKTDAGARTVDLCSKLNDFLSSAPHQGGFLFTGNLPNGSADYWDVYNRLPDALPPFHSFRRYRITHLAAMSVPPELAFFWTGHAVPGVHGRYMKFGSKLEERRDWAERAGLGFEL